MGYYVRAFCTSATVPTLAAIQSWLRVAGSSVVLDDPAHAVEAVERAMPFKPVIDLGTAEWSQVAVCYKPGKLPILAECNRRGSGEGDLAQEEIDEFVESVGPPGRSGAKKRVLEHLAKTQFVVACQLPVSDMDDDGYEANGEFLDLFVEECGGMIQADGEGFYDGPRLVVRLD